MLTITSKGELVNFHELGLTGVLRDGQGQLVAASRGCFPYHNADGGGFTTLCATDVSYGPAWQAGPGALMPMPLPIIHLETDPARVGPRALQPGVYVLEERVAWSHSWDFVDPSRNEPEGSALIRITYTVTERT